MRSIYTSVLLSALAILAISYSAACQSTFRFQRYDTRDGLAFDMCYGVTQDSLGYIWIRHPDALSRFDGYEFKQYKCIPDNPLRSTLTVSISGTVSFPEGGVYLLGEKNELLQHDLKSDGFKSFDLGLDKVVIQALDFEPGQKRLWVATFTGLYFIDLATGQKAHYVHQHLDKDLQFLQNDINGIKDLGQKVLLATVRGLWLFDKATKVFSRPVMNPADTAWAYNSSFGALIESKDKSVWIRYWRGSRVIGNTGYHEALPDPSNVHTGFAKLDSSFNVQTRFSSPGGLHLGSFDFDENDILYSSNADRLLRFDPRDSSIVFSQNRPFSNSRITSVNVDRDQNVWVCTMKGIYVLRKRGLQFQNLNLGGGLAGNLLFRNGEEEYLIAGRSKIGHELLIAQIHGRSPLIFRSVDLSVEAYALTSFAQGRNHLWVAAPGLGVLGFSLKPEEISLHKGPDISLKVIPGNTNSIGHRLVTSPHEDKFGDLWIASKRVGMDWVSGTEPYGSEGSVRHFVHSEEDTTSIQGNMLWQLYPENDTSLWVVTSTGVDLMLWNKTQRKAVFQHVVTKRETPNVIYKTKDGSVFLGTINGLYQIVRNNGHYKLDANLWSKSSISGIQEDDRGRLWMRGSNGLICLDRATGNAVLFDSSDGIDHASGVDSEYIHRSKEGFIVTFDAEGVSLFDPSEFVGSQEKTFPVITALSINNHKYMGRQSFADDSFFIQSDISVLNELLIDYKHNNFAFEYSAMQMSAPEKNSYRHKLEGYETEWIETDYKNRIATYTNLPAGTYTFRVKASNHHGVWSETEKTLKVTILPPPWKTWWAYSIYTLIVLAFLFTARRMIVQRERLKGSLQLEKVEREKEHFELEKAKEVDRVKTSFFTNISHEFRTPLTLIKGPAQDILERHKNDPKLQQQLKLIERNSDLLLKLINQLLDLAKLDAGNLKIENTKGELMRFVKATSSSFSSLAAQKSISLEIDVPDKPCYALFDRDKLETILINLINNAIKFTRPHGKVNINAEVNGSSLLLNVRDTGIGIQADQREKIFERFHQVSESHKEVGTGIGLALVKELVSLLGGTIAVQSEVGKGLPGEQTGSEFTVTLPLEFVSAEDQIEAHEQEPSIDQPTVHVLQNKIALENATTNGEETRPHVLVVEDNADLRSFIIESLGEEFHFLEAENGRQGFEAATTEIPDMIISDVMMPEMDGITMAEKIKTDVRSSHIPLILLTAKSTEASKLTGLESGADDYLTKPFNKHELLLKIRNGISRQRKLREKVMAELMSEAPRKEVLSADEQFLTKVKEEILKQMSNEQLSVESLAEQIGMSRVHLYRKISGLTGMSVNELIRKLRLHRAAQLLQQQWGPVSLVAYEVGFSNLSYFSKVFKEEFGELPSEYSPLR